MGTRLREPNFLKKQLDFSEEKEPVLLESSDSKKTEELGNSRSSTSKGPLKQVPTERNEEVVRYMPLIQKVITRLLYRFPPLIEPEDMLTVGVLGLIEALERYVPGALPFHQYAEIRIRGAILDELRRVDVFSRGLRKKARVYRDVIAHLKNRLGRPPSMDEIAASMGISVAAVEDLRHQVQPVVFMEYEKIDYCEDDISWPPGFTEKKSNDPFSQIQRKEVKERLRLAMEKLPERQRLILFLYYFEDMTLREIGGLLNLSESRICQIHQKACQEIKESLQKEGTESWE